MSEQLNKDEEDLLQVCIAFRKNVACTQVGIGRVVRRFLASRRSSRLLRTTRAGEARTSRGRRDRAACA